MWDFIGITGLLATIAGIVGTLIFAVKRNAIWKKWLISTCVAFALFFVGAVNAGPSAKQPIQQQNQITTPQVTAPKEEQLPVTSPPMQPQPIQQTDKTAVSQPNIETQQQPETKASAPAPQATTPAAAVNTPAPEAQKKETIVYITRTGHKYHLDGCRYLARSQIPISLSDAKAQGYGPCSVCGPPR